MSGENGAQKSTDCPAPSPHPHGCPNTGGSNDIANAGALDRSASHNRSSADRPGRGPTSQCRRCKRFAPHLPTSMPMFSHLRHFRWSKHHTSGLRRKPSGLTELVMCFFFPEGRHVFSQNLSQLPPHSRALEKVLKRSASSSLLPGLATFSVNVGVCQGIRDCDIHKC